MKNKPEITESPVSTIDKIEQLIREKRAPFEARQEHVRSLDAEIAGLASKVDDYLADPTPERLKKARSAEAELVALKSLRERLGDLNIDASLVPVLDQAHEAAPLFEQLADENTAFLAQCRERARQFRMARAGEEEPNRLVDLQLAIYGHQIEEAEKETKAVAAWIKAWVRGGTESPLWAFWPIYRTLKNLKVKLYATTSEMPVPENYCPPSPVFDVSARSKAAAARVLIPGGEPEEAAAVLSTSTFN